MDMDFTSVQPEQAFCTLEMEWDQPNFVQNRFSFAKKAFYLSWLFSGTLFSCLYLFLPPSLFVSLLSSVMHKACSHNHFAFLHFFFFWMVLVLVTASCTMLQTSIYSSSDTLSIRSNPLNLFITSTV